MADRLRGLGLPGVTARTFHAHALSQLRFFWPLHHDGAPLPQLLDSKLPLLGRIARRLPGHYRFTPAKDLADEIEWAKSRRIAPAAYEQAAATASREPPIPLDLFVRVLRRLRAREGARRADRLRRPPDRDDRPPRDRRRGGGDDPGPQALVQRRRVPGHEPAPGAPPGAVGRPSRATSAWSVTPTRRSTRSPARRRPTSRRSPTVHAGRARRRADRELPLDAGGPRPREPAPVERRPAEAADARRGRRARHRRSPATRRTRRSSPGSSGGSGRSLADGTPPAEIAVLVRTNAQLEPIEAGADAGRDRVPRPGRRVLPAAGRPGGDRPRPPLEVRRRRSGRRAAGRAVRAAWTRELGFEDDAEERGNEARERAAALATLAGDRRRPRRRPTPALGAGRAARRRSPGGPPTRRRPGPRTAAASSSRRTTGRRASSGTPSSCRCSRTGRCRSARRSTTRRRSRRSGGCSTSGSRGPGSTSRCRGRSVATAHGGPGRWHRRPSRFLAGLAAAGGGRREPLPRRPASDRRPRRACARVADTPGIDRAARPGGRARPRTDGVPAYVVAHDATLLAIAEARPTTLAALGRVKGMGPTKLDRYGVEILAAIASAS